MLPAYLTPRVVRSYHSYRLLSTVIFKKTAGTGFEPVDGFNRHIFSKDAHSTTLPSSQTAPVGLEPTTTPLTAERSTIELQGNIYIIQQKNHLSRHWYGVLYMVHINGDKYEKKT
jgi:hypothetical protein